MNVGIIGSGDVAKALATGFLKYGHGVMLGTRHVEKLDEWAEANPGCNIGTFEETADFGEVVVLAVKGGAAHEALRLAGAAHLAGKTVIDATNPIADAEPVNGVLSYFTTINGSLMERLQHEFADAHFVKAFNSIGASAMVDPNFPGGKPTMFICGNNDAAKATVTGILEQFGWEIADMGKAEAARAIEPLCMLWCIPGFLSNDWVHAFKLLKSA